MYIVYHRQPIYPGLVFTDQDPTLVDDLNWPAKYEEIAHVEASSLEEVYVKTQHLETAWWHKKGVAAVQMSRSTSVGDIIQDERNDLWIVAVTGFMKISTGKPATRR